MTPQTSTTAPVPPEALHPFVRMQAHRCSSTVPWPGELPGLVRDLVRWDDDAHSPVAALLVFHQSARKVIVITSSATAAGVAELIGLGDGQVASNALVVFAVRAETLAGPDAELDAAPDRGLAAARPGPSDVAVLLAGRDTLRPVIADRWDAVPLDTLLVTEQRAWSVHCGVECPNCPAGDGSYASGLACWPGTGTGSHRPGS